MSLRSEKPEWVVLEVIPREDYSLLLKFADGSKKRVDMRPVIAKGKVFAPLNDLSLFMLARKEGSSVAWTDQIDIAPEYLYENGVEESGVT